MLTYVQRDGRERERESETSPTAETKIVFSDSDEQCLF